MTFAKTFGQRHVLRFLDSHVDLFGCRVTAASPVGLRVTDGVHQLCLKSTDGCIQREDAPNSVAPELIEDYGSTARRTAATRRGELSRMPRRLTLQQAVELPESLLRHFLSHPQLSDVDVRRLVDTGSVDEDAYRVKEAQLREQKAPANSGGQLADALLCHVNYRITAMLHAAYPNARWEWLDEPSRFAVEGGTARIRVYGIPEHDYADVKLDQKAIWTVRLSSSLRWWLGHRTHSRQTGSR